LLRREIQSALRLAEITEEMIERYNERFVTEGMEMHRSLMAHWAVPVGGRFSYSTLAACSVEAVRRVVSEI
jgi:hypothetical protein